MFTKSDVYTKFFVSLIGAGTSTTPSRATTPKVGIMQVANVVDEVYGSANSTAKSNTFPLQQKLIVCTLLLMLKSSKLKEINLGKVSVCTYMAKSTCIDQVYVKVRVLTKCMYLPGRKVSMLTWSRLAETYSHYVHSFMYM